MKFDRSGEEYYSNVPNGNEQPAWEYPISADIEGDGGYSREVLWRPWPCHACRKHATAFDFLRDRQEASGKFPKGIWNRVVGQLQDRESRWLVDWAKGCLHSSETVISLPELARGSEHVVYFDEKSRTVTKVTLPGCFGDFNYLEARRICQAQSTPILYLNRILSEVWIGDTRDENFVMSEGEIVPIDIRLWWKATKAPAKGIPNFRPHKKRG